MSSRSRRRFSSQDKLRIVLSGIADEGTIADLCRREGISSSQFYTWKRQLLRSADRVFKPERDNTRETEQFRSTLSRKDSIIAHLTEENLTLKKTPSAAWTLPGRRDSGK